MKSETIVLFHALGQTSFEGDEIRKYGSLEALMESDILQGVPNREKSLTQLWEAAQMLTNRQAETTPQNEEAEQPQAENSESKE